MLSSGTIFPPSSLSGTTIFLFYIYFRSCDQELSPNHYRSIPESFPNHYREIIFFLLTLPVPFGLSLFPLSPACSFFQLSHALETFTYILQPVPFFTLHHSPVHSIVQSFNRSFVQSFIVFIPSSVSGTTIIYCLYYYSFIFSSGIFFLPEQIRIQSFSVSLCRYDVLLLLTGTKSMAIYLSAICHNLPRHSYPIFFSRTRYYIKRVRT